MSTRVMCLICGALGADDAPGWSTARLGSARYHRCQGRSNRRPPTDEDRRPTMTARFRWTQPCCADCWSERHPIPPHHVWEPETEQCVYCGRWTQDGIYIRIDPNEAPHPSLRRDD